MHASAGNGGAMRQARAGTSVACAVRLVPYSSRVGILLLLLPLPPPTLTVSWLSPTMRITCMLPHATVQESAVSKQCRILVCLAGQADHREPLAVSHGHAHWQRFSCCGSPGERMHAASMCEPRGSMACLRADLGGVRAQRLQHARRDALALAQQAQQDVLRADVVVACRMPHAVSPCSPSHIAPSHHPALEHTTGCTTIT